jgi:hypothetical protein
MNTQRMVERQTQAALVAGSSAPACSVCRSTTHVEFYSVGNVGITQVLPLCRNCKPNIQRRDSCFGDRRETIS